MATQHLFLPNCYVNVELCETSELTLGRQQVCRLLCIFNGSARLTTSQSIDSSIGRLILFGAQARALLSLRRASQSILMYPILTRLTIIIHTVWKKVTY